MSATTIEIIIAHLKNCDPTIRVVDQQSRDIIHVGYCYSQDPEDKGLVVLSSELPTHECGRCGHKVFPTESEGYTAYCINCDEDMYLFELAPITIEDELYDEQGKPKSDPIKLEAL